MRDMYACLMKQIDSNEWKYVSPNIILEESEIDDKGYPPDLYLMDTKLKAQEMMRYVLSRYSGYVEAVKVSKMNRYNLRRESEVLEYIEPKKRPH